MFRTLYRKLLWLFLVFGAVMVLIFILVMRFSHETYHLEFDQTVNRELAKTYLEENLLRDGQSRTTESFRKMLSELARINPSVDLYLLDARGTILAASVPEEQLARRTVNLAPIVSFVRGATLLPILADNPRDLHGREIFSAAPITTPRSVARYLYIVLHREHGTSVDQLRTTYAINEGVGVLLAAVALAVGASLLFLRLLTRRLAVLGSAMERFRGSDFSDLPQVSLPRDSLRGDEIDQLNRLFLELASRVRAQMAELQHTDEMRREFFTNVSHDLRTPLTTLRAHLETLVGDPPLAPQEQRAFLTVALKQCRRLIHLVQQLLQMAKLEAHQVRVDLQPFQLAELLQDVVMKFEPSARLSNVTLHAELAAGTPLVHADIGLIERVLDNLIENAIRQSLPGARVIVALLPSTSQVRVEVRDNGPGIAPADQPRIFDRFYRGDVSRSSESGHAGLGLPIVKEILRLHGASIDFTTGDRGTTFSFALPQAPPRHAVVGPSTATG